MLRIFFFNSQKKKTTLKLRKAICNVDIVRLVHIKLS